MTWILHFCISRWKNLWNSCIRGQEEGFVTLLFPSSFACLEFPITQLSFFSRTKKINIGEIFPIFHPSCGKARRFFRAFLASDRQTIWPRRQKFRALYRKNALQNRQGHILPYFSFFLKKIRQNVWEFSARRLRVRLHMQQRQWCWFGCRGLITPTLMPCI